MSAFAADRGGPPASGLGGVSAPSTASGAPARAGVPASTTSAGTSASASIKADHASTAARRGAPLNSGRSEADSLLGLHIPAEVARDGLLATLALLGGLLIVALAIADDAGIGPRHRQWRARWSERISRR